ncbi:protein of unknown function (plasmid) [Caballeronia sp. S22]
MRDVLAFARFAEGHWTEQPVLVFTYWRGLSKDAAISPDTEHMDAEKSAAAQGVRSVWNAFFPRLELEEPPKKSTCGACLLLANAARLKRHASTHPKCSDSTGSTPCSACDGEIALKWQPRTGVDP